MTTEREALDALKTDDQRLIQLLMERSTTLTRNLTLAYAKIEELKEGQGVIRYGSDIRIRVNGSDLGRGELSVSGGCGAPTTFDIKAGEPL